MDRRAWLVVSALGATALLAAYGGWAYSPLAHLESAEVGQRYAREYPDISHLTADDVERLIAENPKGLVLLDSREPEEFAVAHIAGAMRVSPDSEPQSVVAVAGDIGGKTVVVYCTVGARSSKLATRARKELLAKGARDVASLKGGIEAWRKTGLPLTADAKAAPSSAR